MNNENMVNEKSWKEFQETGMLWWINTILHTMGWAIVFEKDEGNIVRVYPARVRFRGFGEQQVEEGYKRISKYMKDNSNDLYEESL